MSVICPTVTCQSEDLHEYRKQMERVEFADRIQIDLMDGIFTSTKGPDIDKIWFFEDKVTDLHLMYQNPADALNTVLDLSPSLLIIHAEADVHIPTFSGALKASGIKLGIALLQSTKPSVMLDYIDEVDHVLVFSGDLGRFGGIADISLLSKVRQIKDFKPSIEIGWDGGVNENNILQLRDGGVDVINVGGFIQKAGDALESYQKLVNLLKS